MVPISKSIWQLILFVYLNLHFMSIVRFNLLYCFSKIFFRKRSKASPPNFAPPFCALCLIVCDFLPKTWNLGRKAPVKKGFRKVRVCVAMKAPVGLLSGRAVCVSRWRGFAPTSSAERSKRYFHRGGRKGKRHLQRRCGKVFGQTARFTGALAPPWGSCRAATEGLRMEKRKKR